MSATRDARPDPPDGSRRWPGDLRTWVARASGIAGTSLALRARLATDPALRRRLREDPASALAHAGIEPDRAALAVARLLGGEDHRPPG